MPGEPSENVVRRPVDQPKLEAFNTLCNFLDDNDDYQYLLSDLMEILLKPIASGILTDNWYPGQKKDVVEEKRILDVTITILQEDIRSEYYDSLTYPNLRRNIERGRKPSRHLRSRHIINLLHNLGCSVSYSENCKYETSVTVNTSSEVQDNGFVQFVFDNAYHNTRTVDGHGTFHVMGGVQCVTPSSVVQTSSPVPRPMILPTANVVGRFSFIPIVTYDRSKNHGLNPMVMEDVLSLKLRPMDAEIGTMYHWIWMAGTKSYEEHYMGWSGFMEIAAGKISYEKSAVIPLPFVNLQPSNPASINTCFRFAAEGCRKRQQRKKDRIYSSQSQTFTESCIQRDKDTKERIRTAKLWLQYFKQVSIMHDFVRVEKTGDWNLHLFSFKRMIAHLHGAGHIHYAKSAHLYIQNMSKMKTTLSYQEFEHFVTQGIVADYIVNCDSAEELGKILSEESWDISFANVTLKRKMQVFTLAAMGKTITIDKDPVLSTLTNCSIASLFDSYALSAKDAVHMRRAVGKSAAKVDVSPSDAVTITQEQFLSNVDNKPSFFKLLTTKFKKAKFPIFQAPNDADEFVVETAKTEEESGRSAVVVGTDSDLLALIAALTQSQCAVYMLVPGNSITARKVYCSRELHEGLGNMTKHLLFLHAFMGCVTTSALSKRGPISGFNKLKTDSELLKVVEIFNNPNALQHCVAAA
ncbi:hypothetical protein PR048_007964 [Dryococelus australis]|uniref:Uncharacterized protein n=1 Tax=Dryococelus australis TaxID=614101 RepID=A0ABQ9HWL1_9NEOP|nr:hypothetical protein PR048_007964 [Dryococelus australis]